MDDSSDGIGSDVYTCDYYIDRLCRILEIWKSQENPNPVEWKKHVVASMSLIDVLTINKASGINLRPDLELACIEYFLSGVKEERLARMQIDPKRLHERLGYIVLKKTRIDYLVKSFLGDRNPFLAIHIVEDTSEYAQAAVRTRVHDMFRYGFGTDILIRCMRVYHDIHFDRFLHPSPDAHLVEHGHEIIRVLPCSFCAIALDYGVSMDVKIALEIVGLFFAPTILNNANMEVWNFLMRHVHQIVAAETQSPYRVQAARKALIRSTAHVFIKHMDQIAFRDAELQNPNSKDMFWISLDDLDLYLIKPGIGNEPEAARAQFEEYVTRRLDDFELAMTDKDGFDQRDMTTIQRAILKLFNRRNRHSEWMETNKEIWDLLHLMWQIYHLSGSIVVHAERYRVALYLGRIAAFSHEIQRFAEAKGIAIQYGPNVDGTFADHQQDLEESAAFFESEHTVPASALVRGIRGRIYLIYQIYLEARGEKWFSHHWKPIYDELVQRCAKICEIKEPDFVQSTLPAWYWIAAVAVSSGCSSTSPQWEYVKEVAGQSRKPKLVADSRQGQILLNVINKTHHIN
jgi:hypothetical protein